MEDREKKKKRKYAQKIEENGKDEKMTGGTMFQRLGANKQTSCPPHFSGHCVAKLIAYISRDHVLEIKASCLCFLSLYMLQTGRRPEGFTVKTVKRVVICHVTVVSTIVGPACRKRSEDGFHGYKESWGFRLGLWGVGTVTALRLQCFRWWASYFFVELSVGDWWRAVCFPCEARLPCCA